MKMIKEMEKKIKFTKHEDDTEIEFYINNK